MWCGLNAEQDAVANAFGDDAISVTGSMSPDEKAELLRAWLNGAAPVLVTKVAIAGFGLNLQRCARMAFVGLSDSYESYYQAIRRCWRFGQQRPVECHIVLTEPEEAIYANVLRKEQEAEAMSRDLVRHIAHFERAELAHTSSRDPYVPTTPMQLPRWLKEHAA